jgi:hypothetical protein
MRSLLVRCLLSFSALLAVAATAAAQTVSVDISADKAIPFDPDLALGTSLDILPARQFEKVFHPETVKASLSAGWGHRLPPEH